MLALINSLSMSAFAMEEERDLDLRRAPPMIAEGFDLSAEKLRGAEEIGTPDFKARINAQINKAFNEAFTTTIYNQLFSAQNEMLQKLTDVRNFTLTEDFVLLKSSIGNLRSLINSQGNSLEDFFQGDATIMLSGMVLDLNGPYNIVGNEINALVSDFLNGQMQHAHDFQASLDRTFQRIADKAPI